MLQYTNIAIFGGTFDPIHFGHLLVAEQVYNNYPIEEIFFMPAGNPPHKKTKKVTDSIHRLKMVDLAIKDNEHFCLSDYELVKDGDSYTAETCRYFYKEGIAKRVYFIIGADSLLDIFNWREPDYLLKNAYFIVANRPGSNIKSFYDDYKYKPYLKNINIMDTIEVDYSSTRIKQWVKEGKSIRYQTTDSVLEYIENNLLYRG